MAITGLKRPVYLDAMARLAVILVSVLLLSLLRPGASDAASPGRVRAGGSCGLDRPRS
jgi:hypothetical protein